MFDIGDYLLNQIRRAAKLGVEAKSASGIKLTALNDKNRETGNENEQTFMKLN